MLLNGNINNTTSSNAALLGVNKLEKCTHCGINICEKCFNENHECQSPSSQQQADQEAVGTAAQKGGNKVAVTTTLPASQTHYNTVKKEFKQMYNYSKEIVEKLHLLNNTIKMEETAVSELNLIKHQVNTKAIELIKQINQEKCELIEQIENVKRKYESYGLFFFLNLCTPDSLKIKYRKTSFFLYQGFTEQVFVFSPW
jgi:coenzyme F420-reducing hydrogenase delta subunit